jgi:GNAT superfamily N-acetyltransferase
MRPFERGRDEHAAWAAVQEAFRDNYGHVDFPFESWRAWLMDHPEWRPELSFIAWDGDEIAGATMCYNFFNGGWVRQLGVRRPWRKRGLGLALLHHVFGEFYARGVNKVGLGVDAENLTGATRLYERAGMHIKLDYARFEKKLG